MECSRCGRAIGSTLHTKSTYQVSGYSVLMGDTEPATWRSPGDEDGRGKPYLKLTRPLLVAVCTRCEAVPDVRHALDRYEAPPAPNPGAGQTCQVRHDG